MSNKKKKNNRKIVFDVSSPLAKFFQTLKNGDRERLEEALLRTYAVHLSLNGVNMLVIKTSNPNSITICEGFVALNRSKKEIFLEDIHKVVKCEYDSSEAYEVDNFKSIELRHSKPGEITTVNPKNKKQEDFIKTILSSKVTLGLGSAGTGKSYLAIAVGLKLLELKKVQKIIISRPPIESGPSIGFLPGSAGEKMEPYVMAAMSTLAELIGVDRRDKLLKDRSIEIENIGYLRGMTLGARQGVYTLIDEAQNLDFAQHKLLLTRLGSHAESRIILCGDQKQSDLKYKKDTLSVVHSVISGSRYVGSIIFSREDVVRSETVREILGLIEDYEERIDVKNSSRKENWKDRLPRFFGLRN